MLSFEGESSLVAKSTNIRVIALSIRSVSCELLSACTIPASVLVS